MCVVFGNITFADTPPDTPTPAAGAAFRALRAQYPDSILDDDFKTLKKITDSQTYLDFLKQTYATNTPFKTLEEFIESVPPPTERYQDFLHEIFEKPTLEDFRGIHQLTLVYRRGNVMLAKAMETQNLKVIQAALEEKTKAVTKEPIRSWWRPRFSGASQADFMDFFTRFEKFVIETEKADTLFIREQIEKHGKDSAILWVAIRKPVLMGEILNNFAKPDTFFSWVEKKVVLPKM